MFELVKKEGASFGAWQGKRQGVFLRRAAKSKTQKTPSRIVMSTEASDWLGSDSVQVQKNDLAWRIVRCRSDEPEARKVTRKSRTNAQFSCRTLATLMPDGRVACRKIPEGLEFTL